MSFSGLTSQISMYELMKLMDTKAIKINVDLGVLHAPGLSATNQVVKQIRKYANHSTSGLYYMVNHMTDQEILGVLKISDEEDPNSMSGPVHKFFSLLVHKGVHLDYEVVPGD